MIPCPKCSRENADDALYCDQCRTGVSPKVEGDVLAEPCPACGGKVREVPSTAALCDECGIFMGGGGGSHGDDPEPEAPASPAAEPAADVETETCPVCRASNPVDVPLCGGCRIAFERPPRPIPCPRCGAATRDEKCACGAVMTLPKLAQFVDESIQVVCPVCKQLFTTARGTCSDCGAATVPADDLKDYALNPEG
ncbi:MAG: zinc ribbon domain-containing protein [Elusimicrobia bacterium]|nr:zinc ribbon domain-containing protein [Elusimicrobiota bacterium]